MSTRAMTPQPHRNSSIVGADVYTHSGEYSPYVVDFRWPSKGPSFYLARKWCPSRAPVGSCFGLGWMFPLLKKLKKVDAGVEYHDGLGGIALFRKLAAADKLQTPVGVYAELTSDASGLELRHRYGLIMHFEPVSQGGRLLWIEDRNRNRLTITYAAREIRVVDALDRSYIMKLVDARVTEVKDYAARTWSFEYDSGSRLVTVTGPGGVTDKSARRIHYEYDVQDRLLEISAGDNVVLANTYDRFGRVVQQTQSDGSYQFEYGAAQKAAPRRSGAQTTVRLKNGAMLVIDHDSTGHAIKQVLKRKADSPQTLPRKIVRGHDIEFTTLSKFNRHGELIERAYPDGRCTQFTYDELSADPRSRGNLLTIVQIPRQKTVASNERITTRYSYEPKFQRVSAITNPLGHVAKFDYDARGNLLSRTHPSVTRLVLNASAPIKKSIESITEKFRYNQSGDVVEVIDGRGGVTEFHFYDSVDPFGRVPGAAGSCDPMLRGGMLAKVIRDPARSDRTLLANPARLVTEYHYNASGNVSEIGDGKGRATQYGYDVYDRLVRRVSREPDNHELQFRYDDRGNLIELCFQHDHTTYDAANHAPVPKRTAVRVEQKFNLLNRLVRRTIAADGIRTTESFIRDANQSIVRYVNAAGIVSEFRYDSQDLPVEACYAVGTRDQSIVRRTYSASGACDSITDQMGRTTVFEYDGFNRLIRKTNAAGTSKAQDYDAAGNVVHVTVSGSDGRRSRVRGADAVVLAEAWYEYDELNRFVLEKQAWKDASSNKALGTSAITGEAGIVARAIQYAANHRPERIQYETGNVVQIGYDGANQVTEWRDSSGETLHFAYDENGNRVRTEHFVSSSQGGTEQPWQTIDQTFDALDRIVKRTVNGRFEERFGYHAFGGIAEYQIGDGATVHTLRDALGRPVGRAFGELHHPSLVEGMELDLVGNVLVHTDPARQRTRRAHDALNRLVSIIYADDSSRHFQWDPAGNLISMIDQKRNVITNEFDSVNRLVARRAADSNGTALGGERFVYDGLSRCIAAENADIKITQRFDTLSRLIEERQGKHRVSYAYNSAGNCVSLNYPSAERISSAYDIKGRPISIKDATGKQVAAYRYLFGNRVSHVAIGDVLVADLQYNAAFGAIDRVEYRSRHGGTTQAGTAYRFDARGNRTTETPLASGAHDSERYGYDKVGRLLRVQYGVENTDQPSSPFKYEVQYVYQPAGTWKERTCKDGSGTVLLKELGTANARHEYRRLGARVFEYDPSGNRVHERPLATQSSGPVGMPAGTQPRPEMRYAYDHLNRLTRADFIGSDGKVVGTVEFAYDPFGRQVLRRQTAGAKRTELNRIWSGRRLIEEWEEGKPARNFVYRQGNTIPVRMSTATGRTPQHYFYVLNGRGLVMALVDKTGKLVERYRHDVFGQPLLVETADPRGKVLSNSAAKSKLGNPFLGQRGVWDSDLGLDFDLGFLDNLAVDLDTDTLINTDLGITLDSGGTTIVGAGPGEVGAWIGRHLGELAGTLTGSGLLGSTPGSHQWSILDTLKNLPGGSRFGDAFLDWMSDPANISEWQAGMRARAAAGGMWGGFGGPPITASSISSAVSAHGGGFYMDEAGWQLPVALMALGVGSISAGTRLPVPLGFPFIAAGLLAGDAGMALGAYRLITSLSGVDNATPLPSTVDAATVDAAVEEGLSGWEPPATTPSGGGTKTPRYDDDRGGRFGAPSISGVQVPYNNPRFGASDPVPDEWPTAIGPFIIVSQSLFNPGYIDPSPEDDKGDGRRFRSRRPSIDWTRLNPGCIDPSPLDWRET